MSDPTSAVDVGCALHARAQQLRDSGEPLRARRFCTRALALLRAALGDGHADVANVLLELSATYQDRGDTDKALPPCRRAVAILNRLRCGIDGDRLRFSALAQLGDLLVAAGRYREAAVPWKRAARLAERKLGPVESISALNGLGVIDKYLARFDEAEALYRRALALARRTREVGPEVLATLYHNLGGLEHSRGRFARGVRFGRRSVVQREAVLGRRHVDVAADKAALASLLEGCGRLAEAEALYREAIAVFRRALGARHYEVGFNLGNLAAIEHRRGALTQAARLYQRAAAILEEAVGPSHPHLGLVLENFAGLRLEQARPAAAVTLCQRVVRIYGRALGPRHPDTIAASAKLAAARLAV